jgi:predicted N-acyltransferase
MSQWRLIESLDKISEQQWKSLDYKNNPFLSYAFLSALEKFDCLKHQNWQSSFIVIENNNELLGALPLYVKEDSYGEFVFDWAWADAYHQAGRPYYPKLVSAIPFTPVSGSRLLVNKKTNTQDVKNALIEAATSLLEEKKYSSLHFLFPDDEDNQVLKQNNGLSRLTIQYHWHNKNYRDFQDFTDSLTSKKRKKILKERRDIKKAGIEIQRLSGDEITEEQWQTFYNFYASTFYKKWGEPRLTLDFFISIAKQLADQTLLILASINNETVAGAFAMHDRNTLYGRHWGCSRQIPFLHFELCYYQTIEHTIENKLQKLDAGVQGEHKLARGFEPVAMPSAHWIREQDFSDAISNFLDKETILMQEHIESLNTHLPYKSEE